MTTIPVVAAHHVNNSVWHQLTTWFSTRSSWFGNDVTTGALPALLRHVWISGLSLGIAVVIAIPMAVLLARWRRGGVFVTSLANAARSVPIVGVMLLLAVGPIGIGIEPAIIALVIFAIPPLSLRVELPLAIPLIATGVRLATVQVWATATIAAIIGSGGLGQLVTEGYARFAYGEVYGGVFVVVVTAIGLDLLLSRVQRVLRQRYGVASATVAN